MDAPTRAEVVAKFRQVIDGSVSREVASSWAEQWIIMDDPPDMDRDIWEALDFLGGVDMITTDRPYLYVMEDIVAALDQLQDPGGTEEGE